MELIIGKTAGFCFGVKNAVDKTYKQLDEKYSNLYCLGELVHNEKVVYDLTNKGLIIINNINEAPNNSTVIIRAHGVNPEVYKLAKDKLINIIDLTCPKVKNIHELAKNYMNEGYYIMLIAEKSHPETIGTRGFCGENCTIIENLEDIKEAVCNFNNSTLEKVVIIVQTTFSIANFENIVGELKNNLSCDIKIENTICNATFMRQKETEEISKQVDVMIVIGGKNSANTKRLYDIACQNCKRAILIQNKNDNELKMIFEDKFDKIGITAGASTPQESIIEVVEYIKNGGKNEHSK